MILCNIIVIVICFVINLSAMHGDPLPGQTQPMSGTHSTGGLHVPYTGGEASRSRSPSPRGTRRATVGPVRFHSDQRDRRHSVQPDHKLAIASPTVIKTPLPSSPSSNTSSNVHDASGSSQQTADLQEVTTEIKKLTITQGTHCNEEEFGNILALYHAIAIPDVKEVIRISGLDGMDAFSGAHKLAQRLTVDQYVRLREDFFNRHKALIEKAPCSPLWASVEFVLSVNKKDDKTYTQRLEVVKHLASFGDKKERKEIRNRKPVPWWSWFCLPCGPCIAACYPIEGGLMHRAAKANSVDVLRILRVNKFNIDDEDDFGWTPRMYAEYFECKAAETYLRKHRARVKDFTCVCSCCYGEC